MLQTNTYSTAGVFYLLKRHFIILSSPAYPIYGAALSLVWLLFCASLKTQYLYKTTKQWQLKN